PRAPAMRLRHLNSLHRGRKVASRGQPIPRHIQPVPQISFKVLDRAPVHPRSTLVRFYLPERFHHRLLRDRKRLLCRLRLIHRAPPDHRPVGHRTQPWPSRPLGSTPITGASQLLRDGPPADAATVLSPSRFLPLGGLPVVSANQTETMSASTFQRSPREPQIRFTPPLCRTPPGQYMGTRQTPSRVLERNPVLMPSLRSRHLKRRSSP